MQSGYVVSCVMPDHCHNFTAAWLRWWLGSHSSVNYMLRNAERADTSPHMGQDEWDSSQRSMHLAAWKKWPQGSVRSASPSWYSARHTVHSLSAAPVPCSPGSAAPGSPLQGGQEVVIEYRVCI